MKIKLVFDGIYRNLKIPVARKRKSKGPIPAYIVGFSPWKTFISDWLPDRVTKSIHIKTSSFAWWRKWKPWILWDQRSELYVWGYNMPPFIARTAARWKIPIIRVEDGFLRSVKLGTTKTPPISLCFDRSGALYYDATVPSDLETIIQNFDPSSHEILMGRARAGITRLLETRLSKYNASSSFDPAHLYGEKTRKRILVVGQVEGDMSLRLGMERQMNNNELVLFATRENPDAEVLYKPHPEVLHGTRKDPPQSDPAEVSCVARVLFEDVALADAFETIDHVYTMTSLAGFEALLRGIKVTCLGMPFYAGWGLTDDRQTCLRRTARRTVEEVFAAAYILYPGYFDPIRSENISFEQALDLLALMRDRLGEDREIETAVAPPQLNALG